MGKYFEKTAVLGETFPEFQKRHRKENLKSAIIPGSIIGTSAGTLVASPSKNLKHIGISGAVGLLAGAGIGALHGVAKKLPNENDYFLSQLSDIIRPTMAKAKATGSQEKIIITMNKKKKES